MRLEGLQNGKVASEGLIHIQGSRSYSKEGLCLQADNAVVPLAMHDRHTYTTSASLYPTSVHVTRMLSGLSKQKLEVCTER